MSAGPLDDARLRAVETCLNEARFEEAQKQLAALGSVRGLGPGVAYLTARLLFERGRIDHAALLQRLQDLLADWPDFEAARVLLESHGGIPPEAPTLRASLGVRMSGSVQRITVASKRPTDPAPPSTPVASAAPRRLETPRVPAPWATDPSSLATATTEPAQHRAPSVPDLGGLDLDPPRSELPTEPAPPPSDHDPNEGLTFEPEERPSFSKALWDPLEMDLVHQRAERAFQSLERLAAERLDQLLRNELPGLPDVAGEAADFLSTAPITSHFAPFDLTLDSVERLDAALGLFTQATNRGSPYALTVLLTAYVGECVRGAAGGHWRGGLIEPETVKIEHRSGEAYIPWARVQRALAEGVSLRADAGPRPHPAAEPPERPPQRKLGDPTTPWAPEPWPDLALLGELGRGLPNSVIGVWAARVAKLPLDRTPASLPAIDRYVALLTPRPASLSEASWARRPAVLTGAYLGELLCLHAAGRWSENDAAPAGPLRYEVLMPDGSAAYPVLWTYERLRGRGKLTLGERLNGLLGR